MSISPITSPLPGPSSANFSFFPDEDENPTVASIQEHSLQDRIKSVIDRLGYKTHSILHPPLIMPLEFAEAQYEVDKKKFFAKKPISYDEARERVLSYTKDNIGTWGPDLEIKNVDLYADPEFRKEKVKAYADDILLKGRFPRNRDEEFWLIMSFCEEELHDLYKKEPKYLKKSIPIHLWMLKGHNKPILDRHKKEWDQLSPSKKAEKIFGKRRKYEIAAGVSAAAACFFFYRLFLLYQQLQSPQQPSTF